MSDRTFFIHGSRVEGPEPRWRQGYASLHTPNGGVSAEWALLYAGYDFGWGIVVGTNGDESDVGLDVHAGPLLNLYLRARAPWLRWLRRPGGNVRHTAVRILPRDGSPFDVRWRYGTDWGGKRVHGWEARLPAWKVWGRVRHETNEGQSGMTEVPMPEGSYPAAWREETTRTVHVRWPGTWRDYLFPQQFTTVRIDVPGGIPVEGKGENGWDCGMDGLMGTGGKTVAEAVANAVRSATRDRHRYGGPHDLPHPMTVNQAEAWQRAGKP